MQYTYRLLYMRQVYYIFRIILFGALKFKLECVLCKYSLVIYIYVHVHRYTCIHVYCSIHAYLYIHLYIYIYIYIYIYTPHTCMMYVCV